MKKQGQTSSPRKVALALQGGGSHGAYTWGVLDELLQHPDITIDTVSGTSAGAMNAVVLANGLLRGGPAEGRRALRQFWESVGSIPGLAAMTAHIGKPWHLDNSPAYLWFDMMSRLWSPYDLNPLGYHPLRGLLKDTIDFAELDRAQELRVYLCATNVRTGRRRVFDNKELSVDVVLASACLPFVFPAVEIEGESYWDGGYTGNPAIAPIIRDERVSDVILVGINPLERDEVPRHARDIINRVNEISFNSTVWTELAAIGLLLRFIDEGALKLRRQAPHFHAIEGGNDLGPLGASSKMNNDPAFISYLFDLGSRAGKDWLAGNAAAIGQRSTVDLEELLPVDLKKSSAEGDLPAFAAASGKV